MMSSESSEPDTSLNEDNELTEFCQKSFRIKSDSESNTTTCCKLPVASTETSDAEANESDISYSRNNYNRPLNISQPSLEGIRFRTLNTRSSSLDVTTRNASSLDSLGPSAEEALLQNTLQGPSIPKSSSLNALKELETGRIQSLYTLDKPSNKMTLSVKTLDKHSTSRDSSSDTLNEHTIGRSSTVSTQTEHLTCRTSSMDTMAVSSTSKVSRLETTDEPSTSKVSPLETTDEPSTSKVSPLDTTDEPSTSRISNEDPLERPSTSRQSSGGLILSHDPLEGPSTRRDNICGSMESSLTCVAEANTDEQIEEVLTDERNGYFSLAKVWLKLFLIRYSRRIRQSVLYPWFVALLMTLPYSAGYMSCMNLHLCIGRENLASILFLLAITGMLTLITHLATVLSMRFLSPPLTGQELDFCLRLTRFNFALCLILEMCVVFTFNPVFIASDSHFCPEVFYNFAFYAPFVALIVTLLLLLINIPRHFDTAENL